MQLISAPRGLRRILRQFAIEVKQNPGWAVKVPDHIIDAIPEGLDQWAQDQLELFGLVRRPDGRWEKRQ